MNFKTLLIALGLMLNITQSYGDPQKNKNRQENPIPINPLEKNVNPRAQRKPSKDQPQSNVIQRSPSMSKAFERQQKSQNHQKAHPDHIRNIKEQAQQFKHNRRGPKLAPLDTSKQSQNFQSSFKERHIKNRNTVQNTTSRVRNHHRHYNQWFNNNFFQRHHYQPKYAHVHVNWWQGAQWNQVHNWLGWNTSIYPIYYDIQGLPIQVNVVDADNNYPENDIYPYDELAEWLPLGVFVLGSDEIQAAYSNIFIQLAINPRGNIAGTYYNASTNKNYALEGGVDERSQQAYWRLTEDLSSPIMATGSIT